MIQFPFFTMQQLNLDWILDKLKTVLKFMPIDSGNVGDVLQRNADGAAWMPLGGASMDIDGLPYTSAPDDYDEIPIYSIPYQQNRKTTISDIVALASSAVSSVNGQTGDVVLNKNDIGLGSVDNVQQYSATNPPPYPVTSVNGQTGAVIITSTAPVTSVNGLTGDVVLSIPDDTSDLANTAGFVNAAGAAAAAPVQSVNGQTGAVVISASVNITLLWTNPDASVDFATQLISLDLTDYNLIMIETVEGSYAESQCTLVHNPVPVVGSAQRAIVTYVHGIGYVERSFDVSSVGVAVGMGFSGTYNSSTQTSDDSKVIPYRIFGIK